MPSCPEVECAKRIEVTACIPEEKAMLVEVVVGARAAFECDDKLEHSSSNIVFSSKRRVGLSIRAYIESLSW